MDKRESLYYWVIFLINPFLSILLAFKKYREPIAMNIFWGFCIFYGYTFAIAVEMQGSDIVRYIGEIKELYGLPMDWTAIKKYYVSTGEIDYYRTVMAVFLSRITENGRVISLFYAIVYGYFYSRNIWFVINKLNFRLNFFSMMLLVVLFLILPIWYINGVRMYTAMHMFLYGLLPYIWDKNGKRLIFLYASVLVHFSFYPMVLLFFLYRLVGPRLQIYFAFFCLSWFVSVMNFDSMNNLIETIAPKSFQDRTYAYRSETAIETKIEADQNYTANWYVEGHTTALRWCVSISLLILYIKRKFFLSEDNSLIPVFCYTLFFFGIANTLSVIPSGGRFLTMAYFLATSLLLVIMNMNQFPSLLSKANRLMIPAYILFIVVAVRIGIYSLSPQTLVSNPFIMTFHPENTVSINDFIK